MALTTTTLAAAMAATDTQISVTSATGFAANQYVKIDAELLKIVSSYTSGTLIPVLRGQNGTTVVAHPITANVETDAVTAGDWANPSPSVITAYPLSARARVISSYSASGAITIPAAGTDGIAILNGTSALAMTLAAPTTDKDGDFLDIVSNGNAAHTVSASAGFGGAGTTGYTKMTAAAGGQNCVSLVAANGAWVLRPSLIAGTATNVSETIS